MKKSILFLIIVCFILVLVPSCRKKSDGSENAGLVQSLISSEPQTSFESVVVVPAPESVQKRNEDRESDISSAPVISEAEESGSDVIPAPSAESSDIPSVTENEIKEEETVEEVVVSEPEEEVTVEEIPSASVVVSLPVEDEDEVITEEEEPYFSFTYSYGGYSSFIVIDKSFSTLTLPSGVTNADIAAVAGIIMSEYPSQASLVTYSVSDGIITLTYPEQTKEYIYSILDELEKGAVALIDLYPREEAADTDVEIETSLSLPVVEKEVVPAEPEETEENMEAEVPVVEEKAASVLKWSILAQVEPKYNFTSETENPFTVGFGLRFESSFSHSLASGIKAQYDLSSYIKTDAYLKWTFAGLEKFDFYLLAGAGATFGVGEKSGQYSLLLDAAFGADFIINENFSLFGEINAEWSLENPGFEAGASFGARYTF